MLETLTYDTFSASRDRSFELRSEAQSLALELIEAGELGPKAEGPRRQAFSLVFRGPVEPLLEQRIYELRHAELGTLELFMVPVGQDEDGCYYEVVFT